VWTDAHIDERFDQVDARLERMQARIDERFDRLQIGLIVTLGSIIAAFVAAH
jgi:hypothetical protein